MRLKAKGERNAEPCGVVGQLRQRQGDVQSGVVEEGDVAVGVGHGLQPAEHPLSDGAPVGAGYRTFPGRHAVRQIHQIQHILEDNGVVHRTALEVAAIAQDLFGEFAVQQAQPGSPPAFRFGAGEKQAGVDQRLGVGEQVIAQQMMLQATGEVTRLDRQTAHPGRFQQVSRPAPIAASSRCAATADTAPSHCHDRADSRRSSGRSARDASPGVSPRLRR